MEDKHFYMNTLIGLLEAVAIKKGYIPVGKVPNFPADTYRVVSDFEKKQSKRDGE